MRPQHHASLIQYPRDLSNRFSASKESEWGYAIETQLANLTVHLTS